MMREASREAASSGWALGGLSAYRLSPLPMKFRHWVAHWKHHSVRCTPGPCNTGPR